MGIPNDRTLTHAAAADPSLPGTVDQTQCDDPDTPIEGPGGPDEGSSRPEVTSPPPPDCVS